MSDDEPSEVDLLRAALGLSDMRRRVVDAHTRAAAAIVSERRSCVELLDATIEAIREDLPVVMSSRYEQLIPAGAREALHLGRDGKLYGYSNSAVSMPPSASDERYEEITPAQLFASGNGPRLLLVILQRITEIFARHNRGGHEHRVERSTAMAKWLGSITVLVRHASRSW